MDEKDENDKENENDENEEEEEFEEDEEDEEGEDKNEEKIKEKKEKMEKKEKKTKNEEEKKQKIMQPLSKPINEHYYTFQYPKDLFTLLYTSLIFKWIDTTKLLILCNTPKDGYKIDIFLREFRFNSIYLDKEMPVNTNNHFYNQYLKNNYQICIINLEYSEKSPNFAKEISIVILKNF